MQRSKKAEKHKSEKVKTFIINGREVSPATTMDKES
jgi:Na+-translocating ferredoxin:NAD+ oxidoreductase RnfC subunit